MHLRAQNLSDGRLPLWRHGRAWVRGYRYSVEWLVFPTSGLVGFSIGWLSLSIRTPLFAIYLSPTDRGFGARELNIYWNDGCLWICHPFERDGGMERRASDPWWRKSICLHVVDWLIGRSKCTTWEGAPFEVHVPMPEGCYRATAQPERRVWRRRWYWPLRVVESVWLSIPGGIPHAGKGENSWDCGDDGLWGIGGNNVEDAIANAVRSSLKSRRRHGLDSRGTGGQPLRVLNGEAA